MGQFLSEVEQRVAAAANGRAFRAYQRTRQSVGAMMDDWPAQSGEAAASDYWREELEGFYYMFDASPLVIETLREQCYHLTGIKSYEYRSHHAHAADSIRWKLGELKKIDPVGLFVPEARELGGFGFDVGGEIANIDTLKFYEFLLGLEKASWLKPLRGASAPRSTVMEIGTGWGGFAYQFKKQCPNATYICLDLPPTLLFSATYLQAMFPDAKCLMYGEPGWESELDSLASYDFVFLPHYALPKLSKVKIDLAMNMVSFQEMTAEQVNGYVSTLKAFGCPRLYSLNRERSKHNPQMTAVGDIIAAHYKVEMVDVHPLQYTQLAPPKKPKTELSPLDYRHYAATLAR